MVDIDYIMELLDWNNTQEKQLFGVELAQNVKCISAFLQPAIPYGKRVWDNCAKILANRTDDELYPYLHELFEWLQDLNWPGAICILNRIRNFKTDISKHISFKNSIKCAKALEDDVWERNLKMAMVKSKS